LHEYAKNPQARQAARQAAEIGLENILIVTGCEITGKFPLRHGQYLWRYEGFLTEAAINCILHPPAGFPDSYTAFFNDIAFFTP
jgi:hypothetical protein